MDDAWIPFLAALAGAAVGGVANWLVTKAQVDGDLKLRKEERDAEREAAAAEREADRNDRYLVTVASVIGEVTALLFRLEPRRISINFNAENSRPQYRTLIASVEAVRPRMIEAAVLAPDEEQKATIRALERSVSGVVHWDGWILFDMEGDRSFIETLRKGTEVYEAATGNLRKLERLLTGIEPDVGLEPVPFRQPETGESGE